MPHNKDISSTLTINKFKNSKIMRRLLTVSAVVIALNVANVLTSCTDDLECTPVQDKAIINGEYGLLVDGDFFIVNKQTYRFYSIGDSYCK